MKRLLLSVVKRIEETNCSDTRMIAGSMIVCCLQYIKFDISKEAVVSLFQLFTLQPDIDRKLCPELNVLKGFLSKNERMRYIYIKSTILYT